MFFTVTYILEILGLLRVVLSPRSSPGCHHSSLTITRAGKLLLLITNGQDTTTIILAAWTSLQPVCGHTHLTDSSTVHVSVELSALPSDLLNATPSAEYSAVDDLESLAYTLLAMCYMGWLPWSDDIERARSRNPFFGGSKSDMEFIIQTRKRYLDDLHHCGSVLDTIPLKTQVALLDLIMYAQGLKPGEKIDYLRWENIFGTVVCRKA